MTEITWEEPPAAKTRGRRVDPEEVKTASEFVEKPETWGRVSLADDHKKANSLAQQIRAGKRAAYVRALDGVSGHFEALVREVDGKHGVWVRYTETPKRAPKKKKSKETKETEVATAPVETTPEAAEVTNELTSEPAPQYA